MQNPSHNSKHLERIVRYGFRVRAVHESASRFLCRWSIMCDWAVWLIEWVKTDWWTGWLKLTNWLINWFPDLPNDWLPHWLGDWLIDWLADSLTIWLTDLLIATDGQTDWCINWLVTNFSIGWMIYCVLACLLTFSFDGWIDRLVWLMFDRFKTLEFGRFDEIVVSWIWCIKNVSLPCYFLLIKLSSPWLLLFHWIFSAGCGIPSR